MQPHHLAVVNAAFAVHHLRHVGFAGMVFRHFRHGDYSLAALKKLYVQRDLLDSEDDKIDIVQLDSVEDLMHMLDGHGLRCERPVDIVGQAEAQIEPDGAI